MCCCGVLILNINKCIKYFNIRQRTENMSSFIWLFKKMLYNVYFDANAEAGLFNTQSYRSFLEQQTTKKTINSSTKEC